MSAEISAQKKSEPYPVVAVASRISGVGMSVPERIVPNDYFASYLETSDDWIRDRTGIEARRWTDRAVSASELAEPAARQAISSAGLSPDDIDGIVLATVTPDYVFPSTACFLQRRLGIKPCVAFDINAVCTGFIYALVTADSLIRAGQCRNVLVVGVDLYSRLVDPNDRSTCVLFGDGAGAIVLSAVSDAGGSVSGSAAEIRGIYAAKIGADGTYTDLLYVPDGTASQATPESLAAGEHYLRMNGREVFKTAVRTLADVSDTVIRQAGLELGDVDHFICHQANKRILVAFGKLLKIPRQKVPMNVQKYGNTSAASVPLLLAESVADGTVKPGDLLLLNAFGGGFTWGAVLVRF